MRTDVKGNIWVLDSLAGWVWQAPASVLHQCRYLPSVLQCRGPLLLPERQWEMGARDPVPLSQSPHHPCGDTVGPQRRRQSPHRAGQVQREAGTRGGGQVVCRGDQSRLLHWVLSLDSEEPQRGLRCSHCGRHSVLGLPAAAKEVQEQDSRQDEDLVQVLVEEVLLFRMMLMGTPAGCVPTKPTLEAILAEMTLWLCRTCIASACVYGL